MARDILRDYGPDSPSNQKPRASGGGHPTTRDVHNYSPPAGPTNIGDPKSPGLHGHNCGNAGTQGASRIEGDDSGSPGIGPVSHGNRGSQR